MLKLYVDAMSQPARAVMSFCNLNNIQFEQHNIKIAKNEQRSPEFLAINPFG